MVGIPTFAQTWLLTDPKKHGIRASAEGGYTKGKYTGEQGILSYYEVSLCIYAIFNDIAF